jgi:hypothetical protein
MSSHTIVYLDQMYISNMAKARLGSIRDKVESAFWKSIFDDLKAAVLANKIACPESEFQRQEVRLNSIIEKTVGRIISELSWGLTFSPFEAILESQIEEAAYRFLGKTPPSIETWSKAFESDPLAAVESRMQDVFGLKGRIEVSFVPSKEAIDRDRRMKLEFTDEALKMLDEYRKNPLKWPDLLEQSKKGVVDGFMLKRARQSIIRQLNDNSLASRLNALQRIKELENLWDHLQSIGIDTNDLKEVKNFLESRELLDSPFIDIYGSIWAVIGECYIQGRRAENLKSDFYDTPILAMALPYCDVVTTDTFMKEVLVKRFQFDGKYKCKIFSASKTDRVAFQKLVKELI